MSGIFSPGKLMLTSEYVAMDGALVLAIPTKLGQELYHSEIETAQSLIFWSTYYQDQHWLDAVIDYSAWEILETNRPEAAEFVLKVLKNVQKLSSSKFQTSGITYHLKSNVQFPANYGLGSSSTLMANLAQWADIDAFELNSLSLGGSGYDIAVAKEKSAVLYTNSPRTVQSIEYQPDFRDELIFIHLNKKQDSREGIRHYHSKTKDASLIAYFSQLTKEIVACPDLELFSELMETHEQKLSHFLEIPKVKDQWFLDCPVFVKSLGAWGGDFVLSRKFGDYKSYFLEKGFHNIFAWRDLI